MRLTAVERRFRLWQRQRVEARKTREAAARGRIIIDGSEETEPLLQLLGTRPKQDHLTESPGTRWYEGFLRSGRRIGLGGND